MVLIKKKSLSRNIHVFELLIPEISDANLEFISNTVDFRFVHGQIKPVQMVFN